MQIAADTYVTFHYQLTDDEGQVIDSSEGNEPLAYVHGHEQIVPGLEAALAGHVAGDHVDAVIEPEDGYGAYDDDLLVHLPLSVFPDGMAADLEPDVGFEGPHPQDPTIGAYFRVVSRDDNEVVADANHMLAGMTLHFSVDIVAVRAASEAEIAACDYDDADDEDEEKA